jgi:hypothetical protein
MTAMPARWKPSKPQRPLGDLPTGDLTGMDPPRNRVAGDSSFFTAADNGQFVNLDRGGPNGHESPRVEIRSARF